MSDDISKLPHLKKLSNATVKTIKFSIVLSMCINFLAVNLSVLGKLNPTAEALVHNAGPCFVILIAALLYRMLFECYSRIGIVWFRHAMDEKRLNEYCVFLKEALPAHIRRNARPWGILGPKNRYPHIFLDLTVQIK